MGKNKLCRLTGLMLALILTISAVMMPVYASETEAVGSADSVVEFESEDEFVEETGYADSVDETVISEDEGAEIIDEDALIPEENFEYDVMDESGLANETDSSIATLSDESSLSDISDESSLSEAVVADSEDTESGLAAEEEEIVGVTISEGLYYIESALNKNLVLVVAGGSTSNNANIRLGTKAGNFAQAFYVKSDGNGGYYFTNFYTGKRIIVANGSTANGANVQQYQVGTAKTQHWYAVKGSKSGYYQFRNGSSSGKVMEVAGSTAKSGTNVQINAAKSGAANQQWKLTPVTGKVLHASRLVDAKLKNGYYTFASANDSSKVIEVAGSGTANRTNVRLNTSGCGKGQVFYVKSVGSNLYSIVNPYSNKGLNSASTTITNGLNIYQYTYKGATNQKWYIKKDSVTGQYVIMNYKASYVVLGTKGGSITAGTNIQNVSFTGGKGQYWTVQSRTEADAYRLGNGMYSITTALSGSRDMHIEGDSVYNNAVAEIATASSKNSQRFIISCVDKDKFAYKITNQNSRKRLAVSGSKIIQTSAGINDSQKWIIKRSGGYFTIQSLENGMNIAVSGSSTASGTDLVLVSPGSSDAQKWTFNSDTAAAPTARTYSIRLAGNINYALHIQGGTVDNNGNVAIYSYLSSENAQKFNLIANSDGTYYVVNIRSGKVLDTYGAKTTSGTNAVQYGKSSRATQKWKFVPTGDADGSYYIVSSGGTALTLQNSKYTNFSNMCVMTKKNAKTQKFVLVPTDAGNGWRTTTSGKRSYYVNGSAIKNRWYWIGSKYYYFDASGILATSKIVDGYYVDAYGARGAKVSTASSGFKTTINGKKTLTSYLHNAFVPVGRTLYIWGGGWGGDTTATNDSSKIGYQSSWQTFYNSYATSSYDYTKYRFKYFAGLDCSGFVGWCTYNTLYTKDDQAYTVYQSTTVAPTYIKKGWATKVTNFHPGDIVSMDGHVWISLGTCSDKSILLVHSSPKGVQISGTGGVATTLAKKYMKILAPSWPYDIRTVGSGYTSNVSIARWIVNGKGILTDPDGLQNMSAEQVMKFLFGE